VLLATWSSSGVVGGGGSNGVLRASGSQQTMNALGTFVKSIFLFFVVTFCCYVLY
jgi:hypothetical protein